MIFVSSHVLGIRSGMPVGWGVVRQIGDFYQLSDGRGSERKLRSCCGLCK